MTKEPASPRETAKEILIGLDWKSKSDEDEITALLVARDAAQAKTIAELRATLAAEGWKSWEADARAYRKQVDELTAQLSAYSSPVSSEDEKSALRFAESSVSPDWGVLFYAYKDLARLYRARTKEVNDLAAWGAKQREALNSVLRRCDVESDGESEWERDVIAARKANALQIPEAVQAVIESRGKL